MQTLELGLLCIAPYLKQIDYPCLDSLATDISEPSLVSFSHVFNHIIMFNKLLMMSLKILSCGCKENVFAFLNPTKHLGESFQYTSAQLRHSI